MLDFNKKSRADTNYEYLVTKARPLSFVSESIQKFIINLEYVNLDGNYKAIQFTSTLASEGKTTFVSNVAYLLAQKKKKIVVIDLDLRKPKINRVFGVTNENGLTEYLSGKINLEQSIQKADYGVDFIVAGEKTTAVINILESKKLAALIEELKKQYDYVILDTPPVLVAADASYISKLADGIIYVVAQGKAKKTLVREGVLTVSGKPTEIIGFAFIQVQMKSSDYSYYYYESDKE